MQSFPTLYFDITEYAADSIFITDSQARVVYQNPEARRVFQFSDEEMHGSSILEKIHHHYPDGRPISQEQCKVHRAAVHGETARDFVWLVTRKNGAPLYVSCTASPFFSDGKKIGAIFFATDITERRQVEEAAAQNAERLQLAVEAAEIGMFDYSLETQEVTWSANLTQQLGLPVNVPVTIDTFYAAIHLEDRECVQHAMADSARPETDGRFQLECRTIGLVDGTERWITFRGKTLFDATGKPIRRIGAAVDITSQRDAEKRFRDAAQHDSLTGLPNRALLYEYCEHLFAQADRLTADSAVLFIDLDRFKPINDLYGHDIGDKVLQEVARRLLNCTRKEDIVCRLGGDEFIVVLPRIQSNEDPETVAQHILEHVRKPIRVDSLQLSVSPSIGISLYKKHATNITELIHCADLAMYAAKRAGRDTFKTYSPEYQQFSAQQLGLEQRLKEALRSDALKLLYQPVIDIETGQPVGAEAFIRLPDHNGTLLSPDQFIPVAESAGLIDEVGFWVVREACRQQQRWRAAGLRVSSMSINVSASQFRHPEFASRIIEAVDTCGGDPGWLEIEVTESALMDNIPDAFAKLAHLKSHGVRIAVDDFGTGYSSLSQLSTLPLDKLKIDRSFTDNLESDEASRSIADSILGIGRALDLEVVGEGIESEEVMSYLREHGCNQAQGHLFSRPLPASEFESWYRSNLAPYH